MVDHAEGEADVTSQERIRERLLSIECGTCGAEIVYSGTGRRPRYCSATCRTRAWELRRAAAQLGHADPTPKVVREVVERTIEPTPRRTATVSTVSSTPRTVQDWLPLLDQLTQQVRTQPESVVRGPDDWQELAGAVRELHDSFAWTSHERNPPAAERPGLSRQQRRALERERRKREG
ncbi:hypothetical protein [Amycolatopsis thermoflava]|uniref:hypothetical protein n=1 Tax=Amycolatopsis thermoflava TaxID=84480 RepID=UPI003658A2A3